jgi:hypothetical protein
MEYTSGMNRPPDAALRPGTLLVLGLLLLGIFAATMAVWYQRLQTRRCLDFYGPRVARLISKAPRVELLPLAPTGAAGRLRAATGHDVTSTKGIVHLRRGLVEDAGFRWADAGPSGRLPDATWDYAFVFSDPAVPEERAAVVVDLDPQGGWLAVAGQAGRVGLGRLGAGLDAWIKTSFPAAGPPPILPACGPSPSPIRRAE